MPLNGLTSKGQIFVGGPIQHALQGELFNDEVKRTLLRITRQLSECGYRVSSAHIAERFGLDTGSLNPDDVTRRDFDWMRECDLFVAVLAADGDGNLIRTDGTHIELGWASAVGKPIIILTPWSCTPQLSHLVRGLDQITTVRLLDLEAVLGGATELTDVVEALLPHANRRDMYQLAGAELA